MNGLFGLAAIGAAIVVGKLGRGDRFDGLEGNLDEHRAGARRARSKFDGVKENIPDNCGLRNFSLQVMRTSMGSVNAHTDSMEEGTFKRSWIGISNTMADELRAIEMKFRAECVR